MMGSFVRISILLLLSCNCCTSSLELAPYPLPSRLYPSKEFVTVSGNGIGGVMAQMAQISHSKHIKGVAAFSSSFYRCGPGNGNKDDYQAVCTKLTDLPASESYQISPVIKDLQSYDANHLIDGLRYLRNAYLYVYVGNANPVFSPEQQLRTVALYEKYVGTPNYIRTRFQDTAESLRVIDTTASSSDVYEPSCSRIPEADGTLSPNCTAMSAPAEGLSFLLEKEISYFVNPFNNKNNKIYLEPLRSFNQSEFTTDLQNHGLDEIGYLYVPKYCQSLSYSYGHGHSSGYGPYRHGYYGKACKLHIYFHDCNEGREFQGTSHATYSNYLEIAEANNIIVLFPQALSSEQNPAGCWDYFGFSGSLYATKKGPQIEGVWRMIRKILYLPPEPSPTTAGRGAKGRANMNMNPSHRQRSSSQSNMRCQNPPCGKVQSSSQRP